MGFNPFVFLMKNRSELQIGFEAPERGLYFQDGVVNVPKFVLDSVVITKLVTKIFQYSRSYGLNFNAAEGKKSAKIVCEFCNHYTGWFLLRFLFLLHSCISTF